MSEIRDTELRGNVTRRVLQLIDAAQQAEGLLSRMDVVMPILIDVLERRLHTATLFCRMAGVNPRDPAPPVGDSSPPRSGDCA